VLPVGQVEVARRLVGQQDRGVVRESARDRHALLLPPDQLRRIVDAAVREATSASSRGPWHAVLPAAISIAADVLEASATG